jgi:hypothetical protein
MGKQIRFYMLKDDEVEFLNWLINNHEVTFLRQTFIDKNDMCINPLIPLPKNEPKDRYILITIKNNSVSDFGIKRDGYNYKYPKPLINKINHSMYIDEDNANVIEFSRCILNPEGKLVQGRLWVELYSFINNKYIYKGDDLSDLYASINKWIRRNFKKIKGQDGYFGTKAAQVFLKGDLRLFP